MGTPLANLQALYRLGLSESEVALYFALVEHGALTAAEMTKLTRAKRPTVYYALRQLLTRGLVHKSGIPGVERFQAEPPEKILSIVSLRRSELDALEDELKIIIPQLTPSKLPHEGIPKISFFEGEEAMHQAILETLYAKNRRIDYITPHDNFFWQTNRAFSNSYIEERVSRQIKTRHLWEKLLTPDIIEKSYRGLSQIRIIPKPMHAHFRTTTLLYDDTVMYVSSRKSGYVLRVQSKEHHELMSAFFNMMWEIAKEPK